LTAKAVITVSYQPVQSSPKKSCEMKKISTMTQEEFYKNLLGFPDLKIPSIEKHPPKIIIHCEFKSSVSACPNCLETTGVIHQYEIREVQDLKISNLDTWLHIRLAQFTCLPCKRYFFDIPQWMVSGKPYTKRQAKWLFELHEQPAIVNIKIKFDDDKQ